MFRFSMNQPSGNVGLGALDDSVGKDIRFRFNSTTVLGKIVDVKDTEAGLEITYELEETPQNKEIIKLIRGHYA